MPQALPRALRQQREVLALAGDAGMQRLQRKRGGGVIEPLPRQREQLLRVWQRPDGGTQLGAARFLTTLPAGKRAPRQTVDLDQKLGADRDRHLGGGGWRGCALV